MVSVLKYDDNAPEVKFRKNGSMQMQVGSPWYLSWLMPCFTIHGGPAFTAPNWMPVVSCRETPDIKNGVADIHCPIRDFGVPVSNEMTQEALIKAFVAGVEKQEIFVGCGAGIGRTGLFMSLMAKTAGVHDPVAFVRLHYMQGAVETEEQEDYIAEFDVRPVRKALFKAMLGHWFKSAFKWV